MESSRAGGVAAVGAVLMLVAGQSAAPGDGGGDPRPPKVFELHYDEGGDTSPPRELSVFARHTNSMKFATRFAGERAVAPGRFASHVTGSFPGCQNTQNEPRRCHPWKPIRREGGKDVIRLIHHSLEQTGDAGVRVRARRGGQVDLARVLIVDAECSHDPPIYPRTCIVPVN